MDSKNTDQKLKLLQFQNQNLSAQLETQRKELNNLQEKISGYEGKQDDYAQSLLCINRLWEQLNQDILFLSIRATGEAAALAPSALAVEPATESNGTGTISDPYLQQLLKLKVSTAPGSEDLVTDKHASVQSQLTATERLLLARSTQTKATLANLLAGIQQQKEHSDALAAALQSSSADAALKAELLALRGANTNLAVELDATVARCRVAEEELQQQKDRHVEIQHKLQKLQNELADKEEESTIIQKKYYALKMTGVDQLQPSSSQAEGSRAASAAAAAAAAAQLPAGGTAEAQELRELLDKRGVELQKEREAALQLQRELQDLRARVSSDAYATQTEAFRAAKRETALVKAMLSERMAEIEALQKERDAAADCSNKMKHQELMKGELTRQVQEREKHEWELMREKDTLKQRVAELEAAVQLLREEVRQRGTVAELKTMLEVLQKEAELARGREEKARGAEERVEKLSADMQAAMGQVTVAEAEAARLRGRVKDAEEAAAVGKKREEGLQHRINDLQAFVEVLAVFCEDEKAVAALRASEGALMERVAQLSAQKQTGEAAAKVKEAAEEVGRSRAAAEAAEGEADGLKGQVAALQRQVTDLRREVGTLQEDGNSLMREIEVTAGAYEDMQSQNQRLLQQLSERDEANSQLMGERIKANQHLTSLREEMEAAKREVERCKRAVGDLEGLRDKLNQDISHLAGELSQARDASRALNTRVEELKRAAADAEQAGAELKLRLEAAEKLASEHKRALDEEMEKLAGEKGRRQRLEEENKALQTRVERLKKSQSSDVETRELGAEVEAMRKMLNCNVCHERRKDVILTKCFHMFCHQCVRRNLETRHRKCPGCNSAFGQADVKHFFFT